ncbi:MAG: hypothetical protein PVH89_11865 [Gammaproteobacteria bacterium]|jgi:hypothetical protein
MRQGPRRALPGAAWRQLAAALLVIAGSAGRLDAQDSVGRGWPMSEEAEWVGAGVPFYNVDAATARDGDVPAGIEPLARDIFTSDDFYADRALWFDRRYYRCNSTIALDSQWGDYSSAPQYIEDDPSTGAWGHCDLDYAREHIVSPYPFASAEAHYAALFTETRAKNGPAQYSREQMPPDWDGRYTRNVNIAFGLMQAGEAPVPPPEFQEPPQWIIGYYNQIPTILSLLTPEYQQRLVQQLYHQAHDHAAQWSLMFCRPEGFMRWWSGPGGPGSLDVMVTPTRVQLLGGSGNAIRNVHVGREFDLSGTVPRLGPDVPQWMGETIGFWDGAALITWTSNIQGWFTHSSWEYSNKLQTIEIWTARHGSDGALLGLEHEAIFYDSEGLAEPIRNVRFLPRLGDFNEVAPNNLTHCHQTIFPIDGRGSPVAPGTVIEYRVEDLFQRPWAAIWEEHFETDMQRPEQEDLFRFD